MYWSVFSSRLPFHKENNEDRCYGLGAVHILRNTKWGGEGLPNLLQYYIGGGLPNLLQYYIGVGLESLLQYYSFVRKMEGYNPFSALY